MERPPPEVGTLSIPVLIKKGLENQDVFSSAEAESAAARTATMDHSRT
jgi:hypothetical protein